MYSLKVVFNGVQTAVTDKSNILFMKATNRIPYAEVRPVLFLLYITLVILQFLWII